MDEKVGLILENRWLEENQIEVNLMYAYNYDESILIASPKSGKKDILLSFYRLRYDPNERACFIDYKIREMTFSNRKEIKKFISTIHMFAN